MLDLNKMYLYGRYSPPSVKKTLNIKKGQKKQKWAGPGSGGVFRTGVWLSIFELFLSIQF